MEQSRDICQHLRCTGYQVYRQKSEDTVCWYQMSYYFSVHCLSITQPGICHEKWEFRFISATSSYSIIATLSILMRAMYFYVGSSARDAPCLSKKNPTLQCWLLTLMRTHVPAMCWPWSYRQLSCFFNSALNLEIWSALGLGRSLGLSSIQGQSYFFLLGKTSFFCKLSQYSCKLNL